MLKIVNAELSVFAQSFLDEISDVDWGGEKSEGSPPPMPHGDQGIIQEDNFEDFEPAAADEQVEQELHRPVEPQEERPEVQMEDFETGEHPENAVETGPGQQLVYEGIDNNEVIAFDYTNRHGSYAGTRRVEPHYTFVAESTGNEVLVSFDQTKNDIRAFIVGNIHPYGVRYQGENFEPRGEIMRGVF